MNSATHLPCQKLIFLSAWRTNLSGLVGATMSSAKLDKALHPPALTALPYPVNGVYLCKRLTAEAMCQHKLNGYGSATLVMKVPALLVPWRSVCGFCVREHTPRPEQFFRFKCRSLLAKKICSFLPRAAIPTKIRFMTNCMLSQSLDTLGFPNT